MTYGEIIRQSRETRCRTQEQLSESLNVSRQAVSKWEANLARPTRPKLERLSQVLEIPPETWSSIDAERKGTILPCFLAAAANGGEKNGSNQMVPAKEALHRVSFVFIGRLQNPAPRREEKFPGFWVAFFLPECLNKQSTAASRGRGHQRRDEA